MCTQTAVPADVSLTCRIAVCVPCSFKLKCVQHRPASRSGGAVKKADRVWEAFPPAGSRRESHSISTRRSPSIGSDFSTGGNEVGDRRGTGGR